MIPAALEDQITEENASRIKARLIVEGANGPTASNADAILDRNGIMVVPDILANAGGVSVSYFEWVQNRLGYFWTEERVNRRADRIMKQAFDNVYKTARKYKCTLRTAAYIVAIDKVAATSKLRGIFKMKLHREGYKIILISTLLLGCILLGISEIGIPQWLIALFGAPLLVLFVLIIRFLEIHCDMQTKLKMEWWHRVTGKLW